MVCSPNGCKHGSGRDGLEHIPAGQGHARLQVHRLMLVERGVPIIEMASLEELAAGALRSGSWSWHRWLVGTSCPATPRPDHGGAVMTTLTAHLAAFAVATPENFPTRSPRTRSHGSRHAGIARAREKEAEPSRRPGPRAVLGGHAQAALHQDRSQLFCPDRGPRRRHGCTCWTSTTRMCPRSCTPSASVFPAALAAAEEVDAPGACCSPASQRATRSPSVSV